MSSSLISGSFSASGEDGPLGCGSLLFWSPWMAQALSLSAGQVSPQVSSLPADQETEASQRRGWSQPFSSVASEVS